MAMKSEIEELRTCLKDKDKRIRRIEKRYKSIVTAALVIWYVILIPGSYLLLGDAWCYIATNGKYDIFGFFEQISKHLASSNTTGTVTTYGYENPIVVNENAGVVLIFMFIILLVFLTIGWFIWFVYYDEIHQKIW